jgi:ATP-dependent DNA helicase RecQ
MAHIADAEKYLKKLFGFDQFKGDQKAIIQSVMEGHDTFVIMPTGGGKSLCYQLPGMMIPGMAVVVSPLIALMKNQVDALRGFSTENGVAHVLNSSLSRRETLQVHEDVKSGVTRLLYVAPESLTKDENVEFLRESNVSFYAIDEAHCISEWGHDFRPEYRNLRQIIQKIGRKPIIALTATATPKVQSDIIKTLGIDDANVFKSSFNRPNLFYEVRPKGKQVDKDLIKFIRQRPGKSGIIYCLSRKKVEELAQTLQVNGIKALPYHAGLDANSRARHQDAFLMEESDVIVATIAFGMGIDKPDVRFVIHYDMPKSLEGYYQETGRAGRDGGEGHCLAFYSYDDIEKLEKFLNGKPVSEQEIGMLLLQEVVAYAETSMNRRKFLLNYFGEEFDELTGPGAENDDNTQNPKAKFDASKELTLVMEAIRSSGQRFKAPQIVNLLQGEDPGLLKSYKVNTLPQFGKGKGKDPLLWMAVIRQALVRSLLSKDIETYGVVKLNAQSEQWLKHPEPFMITEDHRFEDDDDGDILTAGKAGFALDEALFNMLKELVKKEAKKLNQPPYTLFQETSISEMATSYPTSLDELKNISGVSEGKAKKFGKPFVELIARYVKDNDIEKTEDMVVKSVMNKSTNKVYIITSIDRKMPLEDIANAKGMSMDDLLREMENIIYSGTKLNIDYYLNDALDEDAIEEIFDYFMEAESDDLTLAHKELDGAFDESEIRLVRMKFMSEVAN